MLAKIWDSKMTLNDVKAEIKIKNYTKALELLEAISDSMRTAEYYLLRGICIQLPNQTNLRDTDAEFSLRKAVELDPNYLDAKLELAYFLLNIRKDPSSAKKYFLEVLQATRDEVPSTISSIMETSHELKQTYAAFANTLKEQAETFLSHE